MILRITICYLLVNLTSTSIHVSGQTKSEIRKQTKLPPCRACKTFVDSFKKGFARTEHGKFEGGDTAWEEEKLGSYANSEIRLTEIQEKLCSDVDVGGDQCYTLLDEYETDLENWWFEKERAEPDLYVHLCINLYKHCCPENHFGEDCTPCTGFPDSICSNNGKCKGAGTRKGSGQCSCDKGYTGEQCNNCSDDHFVAYKDDKKLLCAPCHVSCDGACSKAGAVGCSQCKLGWLFDQEKGCLDLNECAALRSPCSPLQFCVNNDGSFRCLDCDRACAGCSGDGPDMCLQCAKGYKLVDNVCIDSEQDSRKNYVYFTRYLTYFGLLVATCIIFNKSITVAAIIGLTVAIYISMSEYILNTAPTPKTDALAEQLMRALN